MQPNFQFNSTATVENQEEIDKKNNHEDSGGSHDYAMNQDRASNSMPGAQFEAPGKGRITPTEGYLTIMNKSNRAPDNK